MNRSNTIIKFLYLLGVLIPSILIVALVAGKAGFTYRWMDEPIDFLMELNMINPLFLYYAITLEKRNSLVRATFVLFGILTFIFLGWIGLIGTEKLGFLIDPSFIDDGYLTLSFFSSLGGILLVYVYLYRGPELKKIMPAKFFLTVAAFIYLAGGVLTEEWFHLTGFILDSSYLKYAGKLSPGGRDIRLILVRGKKGGRNLAVSEPLKHIPLNKVHGYLKYVCPSKGFFADIIRSFNLSPPTVHCPQLSVTEESGRITISDGENSVLLD